MDERYRVNIRMFFGSFITWSCWMAGWVCIPAGELLWAPLKCIIIALFAPIGIILLGSLKGYRVRLTGESLQIGLFPFIRTIPLPAIACLSRTPSHYLRFFEADECITVHPVKGREIVFPCNDADRIIQIFDGLKQHG